LLCEMGHASACAGASGTSLPRAGSGAWAAPWGRRTDGGPRGFIFMAAVSKLWSGLGHFWMRIFWRAVAVAFMSFSVTSVAFGAGEAERYEPEIDMFASMTGKCGTLKIAERDFACTSIAFSHSPGGRSGFTVPLNDPDDASHIVTFSGEISKREQDNRYELAIDRMLVKSKDRPKVDGLPLPAVEPSTGVCKQIGNLAQQLVSSVSCTATAESGKKYEFQFESDGSPIKVRTIRVADRAVEEQRTKVLAAHLEQLKCRQMAIVQGVLPRDRTAFILQCMEE
jgi:hypothetical protein